MDVWNVIGIAIAAVVLAALGDPASQILVSTLVASLILTTRPWVWFARFRRAWAVTRREVGRD